MKYSKTAKKSIALTLITVLASQILLPNVAMALTTGPSQPEVQSFEPVGTTDMVDMFSGGFVYNIPLMDVEGYPVNISYHGGVTMEQEASWVGLGWNINPGEINRTVRGLPDDCNGDTLSKQLHIKEEKTLRVGVGIGGEVFGAGDPLLSISASLGANLTFNNYRGTSCDFNLGAGINLFRCASVGVNIGVGSATGADISYDANLGFQSSQILSSDMAAGVGVGVTQGYSSRSGLKDIGLSFTVNGSANGSSTSKSFSNTIPIGIKNYVPVITNSSTMTSIYGRIKLGAEFFWCFGYGTANGMFSRLKHNNDGSKDSYGYLYLQNAPSTKYGILDFTRDKDGQFNKSMQYLPPANLTYDIYNVSGQGTGGMFRPYRNDFGSVYDPITKSEEDSYSLGLEGGLLWIFEVGGDFTHSHTDIKSGPWAPYTRNFTSKAVGSLYEDTYLKQGGELTAVDAQYFLDINGFRPIDPGAVAGLPTRKANSLTTRDARGNLIYYYTGAEDTAKGVGTNPNIVSYTSTNGFSSGADPAQTVIKRVGSNLLQHKKDEISEIVQLQKDGRKYIYGIPALNHVQKEATFSVDPPGSTDLGQGIVPYSSGEDGVGNTKGRDNYYSSSTTASYAHSYLLTCVQSADYVDVTGNGPSDDDLGSYTKLNYALKDTDYRWRAPYQSGKAQYNPGFWSDSKDDKGSYVCGSREQWILHSIETRNFVAEFYTSQRNDGCGSTTAIVNSGCYNLAPYNAALSSPGKSYKLDSIKLYNKHDRFINKTAAVPVKTAFFTYTDALCSGIPNSLSGGTHGKLTLDRIYFSYGSSQKSMISPYEFSYGYNPNYDLACKDRWGNYKPNNTTFTNYEYPFVNQSDTMNNTYASAWSLTSILLPSGGKIEAAYESNDYAFVQDKAAMEMFMVKGVGNGPNFNSSRQLYSSFKFPYVFVYFQRRAGESPGRSIQQNYFNDSIMYYNFNVRIHGANSRSNEQIKGYATIDEAGVCPNNALYGYVKLRPVTLTGSAGVLNPITATTINTGRYNLPHVIYPGSVSDPDDGFGMLRGLKSAFSELIRIHKNPVEDLLRIHNCGRHVNLNKSFIRLVSPGLRKKGGGQRVKHLLFYDSWNSLAGGSEQNATYGKRYDYNISDSRYGVISSGVASYEPLIGGDENPWRTPVPYIVESGSNWPPNNPTELFQETPIGESLFPSALVGYRKVTVSSIHMNYGKSAQGVDVYQFYTAKEFPVQVIPTAINSTARHHFDLFRQVNDLSATQGYSLIFNDMHGKPKSVEHFVRHPTTGGIQMTSYQKYNYKMVDGLLDNHVNCLVYDPGSHRMVVRNQQLGVEADVTIDTRQKTEETQNNTYNGNLNVSGIFFFIVPLFFGFEWPGNYKNEFTSASVTKVVQQYGILDNVQASNEGAVTVMKNELFDPQTGQVVVTSVNNEYHDKEYTVNVPAYWGYSGMGPAYKNIKYEAIIPKVVINTNRIGLFLNYTNLNVGDELLIDYDYAGTHYQENAWFHGSGRISGNELGCYLCCAGFLVPRFPLNTPGWTSGNTLNNVGIKVINSGAKNLLNETIESYTMLNNPIDGFGYLKDNLDSVISIKSKTFCDSNTRIIARYINNADTINPYVIGERGIYRVLDEYAYITNRNYAGFTARNSGLFNPPRLYSGSTYDPMACIQFPYNYMAPAYDPNWRIARTVTKWSPYGKELENRDAVGNYSSAIYSYNHDLPSAVASNAMQGEVLADGFEDYNLLHTKNNVMDFTYSPFGPYFSTTALSPTSTNYDRYELTNPGDLSIASVGHTGTHSLLAPVSYGGITGVYMVNVPVLLNYYLGLSLKFNSYYWTITGLPYRLSEKNEYLPFKLTPGKKYILSYWVRSSTHMPNISTYAIDASCGIEVDGAFFGLNTKSNIIDRWQQVECVFTVPTTATTAKLRLPVNFYVDDIRLFPADANMKSFVYNPINEKLMATLDENNFASFYEYDQEGNLVRVKKETEKGIMSVSESRSNNPKK